MAIFSPRAPKSLTGSQPRYMENIGPNDKLETSGE
jgi:hypothetical protein